MRKIPIIIVIMLIASALYAQSNGFIDDVLNGTGITGGEAAYLVLVASDNISDDADASRAYELLGQLKWIPPHLTAEKKITHAEYSYLLMKAFAIKGGIFYHLFPSPRYAYRELKNLVVIQGSTDPDMPVSGPEAMRMIGRIFDVKGVKQ